MTTTSAKGTQCRRRVVEPRLRVVETKGECSAGGGGGARRGTGDEGGGGRSGEGPLPVAAATGRPTAAAGLREATTMLLQCWPRGHFNYCYSTSNGH